ncbi:DUF3558 domain-containing protein [Nocardia sp. NPDC056064]|uniref:DUF3558 domain-containing protein n=1 Tax=Nocardia sp. NPDC056064 TaxID=3345701 RepID=UPI0035D96452
MRKSLAIGCLVGAATLVGCAEDSVDHDAAASTSATAPAGSAPAIKVSVPPAPTQTGSTQVRLDPCVSVGDELVSRAGFDPATRERYSAESVSMPFTRIGCQFWRETVVDGEQFPTGIVAVTSSDLTLDDIRKNPGHSVFDANPVAGREAVLYRTPENSGACSASVRSADGTFTVSLIAYPGPVPTPSACDQIRVVAETFGESLGT